MMRVDVTSCLAAAVLAFAPLAADAQRYALTNLGTLGGTYVTVNAVNAGGQATGYSSTTGNQASHAFIYSKGTMQDLGTIPGGSSSFGQGINAGGQVTGYAYTAEGIGHAFLYGNGTMSDLGSLPGNSYSFGTGVSDSGEVSGWVYPSNDTPFPDAAFLYVDGKMASIGTLGGVGSEALGISANGLVTGAADTDSGFSHAFLYSHGKMQDLGSFDNSSTDSVGYAVNDGGQVTGNSEIFVNGGGTFHAFLYHDGTLQDLGSLSADDDYSAGYGINAQGQVVGFSGISSHRAILYSQGRLSDLNTLIPAADAARYTLTVAQAINDNGQIVVNGYENSDPTQNNVAFLLNPIASVATTATRLTASAITADFGTPITLSALVTPMTGATIPKGTVTFQRGTIALGAATLDGTGKAGLSLSTLGAGEHSLTAKYSGDSVDGGSTSRVVGVRIAAVGTTTLLEAAPITATAGTAIELTATVAPVSGVQAAHGKVNFSQGKLSLGTASVDDSGKARLSTSSLAVGSDSITAEYVGDSNDEASASKVVIVTIT